MTDLLINKPFRAMIPYNILLDLDLNAQHIRLYGMIEQMESNPKTRPTFSYNWIGTQLGLKDRRGVIRIAEKLKSKGYIGRKQNNKGQHVWFVVRHEVVGDEEPPSGVPDHPPSGVPDHPPSGVPDHPKSLEDKSHKLSKEKTPAPNKLSLNDLQDRNLLNIPDDMLNEWLSWRKTKGWPLTIRVWNAINKNLNKCIDEGISATEAFEFMLVNGYRSIEPEWILNRKPKPKGKFDMNDLSFIDKAGDY